MKLYSTINRIAVCVAALLLDSSVAVHAADDTIERIKSANAMRVCFADDNPWSFKNPSTGKWEGVTPDLVNGLAEAIKVKLVEVDANWPTLIQSITADKCDIIAAPVYATVTRAESVIFSNPYAYETSSLYVLKDSPIKSYADLDQPGKIIAVRGGTAAEEFSKKFFKNATIKPYLSDSNLPLLTDIMAKRVDAMYDSTLSLQRYLAQNPQYAMKALEAEPLDPVQLIWVIKPGDYRFQQLVNTYLFKAIASKNMERIWQKYFETPYVAPN